MVLECVYTFPFQLLLLKCTEHTSDTPEPITKNRINGQSSFIIVYRSVCCLKNGFTWEKPAHVLCCPTKSNILFDPLCVWILSIVFQFFSLLL